MGKQCLPLGLHIVDQYGIGFACLRSRGEGEPRFAVRQIAEYLPVQRQFRGSVPGSGGFHVCPCRGGTGSRLLHRGDGTLDGQHKIHCVGGFQHQIIGCVRLQCIHPAGGAAPAAVRLHKHLLVVPGAGGFCGRHLKAEVIIQISVKNRGAGGRVFKRKGVFRSGVRPCSEGNPGIAGRICTLIGALLYRDRAGLA